MGEIQARGRGLPALGPFGFRPGTFGPGKSTLLVKGCHKLASRRCGYWLHVDDLLHIVVLRVEVEALSRGTRCELLGEADVGLVVPAVDVVLHITPGNSMR